MTHADYCQAISARDVEARCAIELLRAILNNQNTIMPLVYRSQAEAYLRKFDAAESVVMDYGNQTTGAV